MLEAAVKTNPVEEAKKRFWAEIPKKLAERRLITEASIAKMLESYGLSKAEAELTAARLFIIVRQGVDTDAAAPAKWG